MNQTDCGKAPPVMALWDRELRVCCKLKYGPSTTESKSEPRSE